MARNLGKNIFAKSRSLWRKDSRLVWFVWQLEMPKVLSRINLKVVPAVLGMCRNTITESGMVSLKEIEEATQFAPWRSFYPSATAGVHRSSAFRGLRPASVLRAA